MLIRLKFLCLELILVLFINTGYSLRLLDIQFPSIAIYGKPAQLNCSYELEQDQLYSIKWYHNDDEFYRYLPNDNPPEQFYRTKGLYVDLKKSKKSLVYLSKVDLKTDGLFRCEVSAEAPSFQTVRKEKYLFVYYFPREAPILKLNNSVTNNSLYLNDILDVTCQSGPAKPATKLQFFLNDLPISQAYSNLTETVNPIIFSNEDIFSENKTHKNQLLDQKQNLSFFELINDQNFNSNDINQNKKLVLFSTSLRLRIRLRQFLLRSKKNLNLRCTSFVTHLFTKTSEHVFKIIKDETTNLIEEENLFKIPKQENSKTLNKLTFGPFIENGKNNYAVGDLINVTCLTGSFKPPAYLQWFINDEEAPFNFLRPIKPIETKEGLKSLLGLQFILTEDFLKKQNKFNQDTDKLNITNNTQIKYEIKLKCVAQLSRIVHVKTKQLNFGDQSKIIFSNHSIHWSFGNIYKCVLIFFIFCFENKHF